MLNQGHITFGCFNNFAKVTDAMLEAWARILQRVPRARLALKNLATETPSIRRRLHAFLGARGIGEERIRFLPHQPSALDHLRCYESVDIALDTFPYHGTTTTCEALWMGVPVVTLAGQTPVSRVGVSLLNNVNLAEFVAATPEQYVEIGVAAAADAGRLATLRASLRARMQGSPLMDAPRFARAVEAAYRSLWRQWCVRPVHSPR
jgi:predicted O-linked N-acetylglucosamine transferase (SPINDLY family)